MKVVMSVVMMVVVNVVVDCENVGWYGGKVGGLRGWWVLMTDRQTD